MLKLLVVIFALLLCSFVEGTKITLAYNSARNSADYSDSPWKLDRHAEAMRGFREAYERELEMEER